MILLDSNLLLRLADTPSPQRPVSRGAILKLYRQNEKLVIVAQNLYEFWVVATRGAGKPNGLGMPAERTGLWLDYFQRRFELLPESNAILFAWRELMAQYRVAGYRAHDARLVAAMQVYKIDRILTFNIRDFSCYPIKVLDPSAI